MCAYPLCVKCDAGSGALVYFKAVHAQIVVGASHRNVSILLRHLLKDDTS